MYQSYYSGVICKFDYCIGAVGWYAVMVIEGVEKKAQHTALWSSSVRVGE